MSRLFVIMMMMVSSISSITVLHHMIPSLLIPRLILQCPEPARAPALSQLLRTPLAGQDLTETKKFFWSAIRKTSIRFSMLEPERPRQDSSINRDRDSSIPSGCAQDPNNERDDESRVAEQTPVYNPCTFVMVSHRIPYPLRGSHHRIRG